MQCLVGVDGHTQSFLVAHRQVEHGRRVALPIKTTLACLTPRSLSNYLSQSHLRGGGEVELSGFGVVLCDARALHIAQAQVVDGLRVALGGRELKPPHGLRVVQLHAVACRKDKARQALQACVRERNASLARQSQEGDARVDFGRETMSDCFTSCYSMKSWTLYSGIAVQNAAETKGDATARLHMRVRTTYACVEQQRASAIVRVCTKQPIQDDG